MTNRFFAVFVTLFVFTTTLKAQIVFFENFENGMPALFTLHNADSLTPNQQVGYFGIDAWIVRTAFNETDSAAISTSWYSPEGTSDDWMVTPAIAIGSNAQLTWSARAQDADFPDGYEVLISTTGTDIADFTYTAFTIGEENTSWTNRTIDLNAEGFSNTTIYVAFRNTSTDKFVLLIDDIKVKNLTATDVEVGSVTLPKTSCTLTNAEAISVTVKNVGLNDVSNFSLSYTINGGATITETYTATLQPNQTATYTFTQTADFSATNTPFNAQVFSSATSDGDLTNDTAAIATTINVQSTDVLADGYATGFENATEILGWSTEDVNNDNSGWDFFTGQSYNGNFSILYLYDETNPANDWLFSTCLDLVANQVYRLDFAHKVGTAQGTIYNEKFLVSYGTAPQASSMTTLIKDFGEVSNDSYVENTLAIVPVTTGTYYIGFKVYSDADKFYLSIDDISVSELLAPVASFTYTASGLTASFTSTGNTTSLDSLTWNFGDNTTGTGKSPSRTYTEEGTYYVCLTVTNVAGTNTFCDSVTVQSVGIKNLFANNLKLFPNPTQGVVNVVLPNNSDAIIEITNTIGSIVYTEKVKNETQHKLNLSELNNGVYFITVEQNGVKAQNRITVTK
jgi:PKD repeat protein